MLNPKLRGWALYHRHGSSKETLSHVDHAIFQTLWQWAKRRHPRKGKQWIKNRYFKRVGNRSWTFSGTAKDPGGKSTEKTLCKASSVPIKRQVKIQGACNPDQRAHLNRKVRFGVGRYGRPSHASIMPAPPLQ